MIFSVGAQVLDAVLIKTSMYLIEGTGNLLWWTGSSLYHWYSPPQKQLTETELLREELASLKNELDIVKHEVEDK